MREIEKHINLYRDDKSGIAWIEDGTTGTGVSVHPNIDSSGSVRGMKDRGYWGKKDRTILKGGNKMEKITLDMCYGYKGSSNCTVTLQKNAEDDTISVITDYGEVVAVCTSGHGVARVLKDLDDKKYA